MTPELIEKIRCYNANPTPCNWFQLYSQKTWDRIEFVRTRNRQRIYEPTITQNLIFEFQTEKETQLALNGIDWGVNIFESINERASGNDLEIFIETNEGFINFVLQAKIIYHNRNSRANLNYGSYPTMNHHVGDASQVDLLINYSRRMGAIPLFLLYNYVNSVIANDSYCNIDYGIGQYGCSIVDAKFVKSQYLDDNIIPNFYDLHPAPALPWFILTCCMLNNSIDKVIDLLELDDSDNMIRIYNMDEIQNDKNWIPLLSVRKNENSSRVSPYIKSNIYNPKFRMVIQSK